MEGDWREAQIDGPCRPSRALAPLYRTGSERLRLERCRKIEAKAVISPTFISFLLPSDHAAYIATRSELV